MKKIIPVAKPYFTKDDEEAVASVVRSGWVLQGPKVEALEKLLGDYIGSPYSVATSSATTAMHLGLLASGIGPGDEVLVPSFSFIASANCIVHAGATPVFVDIDPATYNLDPADVERKITKKTRGILAVHQVGLAADLPKLAKTARTAKVLLFEDCACGLASTIHGKHVGNWGAWGAFSFHPRKAITTAEGGLLVTKNANIAKIVSMLRAHGASIDVKKRDNSRKVLFESYPLIGYNLRMSDIHAALGLSQFTKLASILEARQEVGKRYNMAFAGHPVIIPPFIPEGYFHTYQSYMIRLSGGARIRDRLMQKLLDAGIATRRGIPSAHLEAPYRKLYPKLKLPHTELASKETLTIPIYKGLTPKEQDFVIDRILTFTAQLMK